MRWIANRYLLKLAFVIFGIAWFATTTPARTGDDDYDGIDDVLEDQLAEEFLPELRSHEDEGCGYPGSRPVLFRLRHPSVDEVPDTNYVVINYIRLFSDDCGVNSHQGDNEAFAVFLKKVNGDWMFSSVSAAGHANTPCEAQSEGDEPIVWFTKNKHAPFADLGECDSNVFCADDHCDWDGPSYSHTLVNVGEPSYWLFNDLGELVGDWDGEYVWNDYNDFLGAGDIRAGLFLALFSRKNLTPPPGLNSCLSGCQGEMKQCIMQNPFMECLEAQDACNYSCYLDYHWDNYQ